MNKIKVAVMNTSKEVTDMLQNVLSDEGFETSAIFTYIFKNKNVGLEEYVEINNPDVVLYDIAIPYDENYKLFKDLSPILDKYQIPYVVTTTNKKALDQIVGETPAYELIGKPYDLEVIVSALKNAYSKKVKVI